MNKPEKERETKSSTVVAGFAGQKGGSGKSTVLISLASHLHYALGKRVIVIDADKPQWAVSSMRNNELTGLAANEDTQRKFVTQNMQVYPVQEASLGEAALLIQQLRGSGEYDVILVDTPGTLNMEGYKECMQECNFIFAPIEAEEMSLNSSFEFISYIYKNVMPGSHIKGVYPFWNKFVKNAKTDLFKEMHVLLVGKGITVLNQILEFSVHYQRPYLRSTLFPLAKAYGKSNLMALLKEIEAMVLKTTA